jgi:ribonuclease E
MKMPRRHRPPIQNCLKRGDKVIVQVIKEGIGTKGPTLSSYISIPGRFLVMMPGMEQLGVSRKIEDEEQRRKMREALSQLSLPKEMGFIMRTAGADRTKRDLQRDLNFLSRLWKQVDKRIKQERAPTEIYRESDLVIRTIRDVYDSSLHRIVVDSPTVANRVRQFLAIASPRSQDIVEVYEGPEPLFHRYGIEAEIDRLHLKTVPLPCGGSLVIEQTEALVAIDVNSGRFRIPDNAEETAYRVNLEAADEIARQLRLRDLGGLIICDLIDMGQDRHRRTIERRISEALRKHKERAKVLRISKFGLMEMTRQRQRQSFNHSVFQECPRCGGSGRVKAPESVALEVMRRIRLASQSEGVARIDVRVSNSVAGDLLNRKRLQLADLERRSGQTIRIQAVEGFAVNQVVISCSDRLGREVHQASHSSVARQGPEARSTHSRSRQTGGKSRGR